MKDKLHEELSALMDGEASELELRRIIKSSEEGLELRQKWERYHLARSVMKGEARHFNSGHLARHRDQADSLADRVALAIEDEAACKPNNVGGNPVGPGSNWVNLVVKPMANVAVAASVSAMVILGWQSFDGLPGEGADRVVAQASSGSRMARVPAASYPAPDMSEPGVGFTPVAQRASGTSHGSHGLQVADYNPEQDVRLNQYLISHSGNAAINTFGSSHPYARVMTLKVDSVGN